MEITNYAVQVCPQLLDSYRAIIVTASISDVFQTAIVDVRKQLREAVTARPCSVQTYTRLDSVLQELFDSQNDNIVLAESVEIVSLDRTKSTGKFALDIAYMLSSLIRRQHSGICLSVPEVLSDACWVRQRDRRTCQTGLQATP